MKMVELRRTVSPLCNFSQCKTVSNYVKYTAKIVICWPQKIKIDWSKLIALYYIYHL